MSTIGKAQDLLEHMAFENPRPVERWFANVDFDPSFGRTELRYALQRKWIELDTSDDDNWRFRFTEIGREYLEARAS